MKSKSLLVAAATVSIVLIFAALRTLNTVDSILVTISEAHQVNKSENTIKQKSKLVCAEVPTECGFPLTFYAEEGESADEFAARIKAFLELFEKNWND